MSIVPEDLREEALRSLWVGLRRTGPILPDEPEKPTSLQDAEYWCAIYDKHWQTLVELGRQYNIESELQGWIERCARRKSYWARARQRLGRLEDRDRLREQR